MPVKKQGKARVSTTDKKSGEIISEQHAEFVEDEVISSNPLANVGMSIKKTTNLGNFESVSVEVSLRVPCEVDEVDDAFEQVESWIEEKLTTSLTNLGLLEEED